jgi:branched-subunit amino acid aminotransferase/4-amino-4-deoxychorismate lyase
MFTLTIENQGERGSMNQNSSEIFNYVVVNSKRMRSPEAQTWLFNPAFLASFGVYETIKIDRGRPFYLEEHFCRLIRSAEMIGLDLQVDLATLVQAFESLIEIDRTATWTLKILGLGALETISEPITAFQSLPLATYPAHFYEEGATAVLYEGKRALPLCKSLNTLVNHMARQKAGRYKTIEGLLHNDGYLTEGSRSSLFVVKNGHLLTAPQELVLPGITRDVLIEVMQETAHPVGEELIPAELSLYDELFITSTSMHVMPITMVEGRPIGSGQVGPVTKLAMERFNQHYRQYMAEKQA